MEDKILVDKSLLQWVSNILESCESWHNQYVTSDAPLGIIACKNEVDKLLS